MGVFLGVHAHISSLVYLLSGMNLTPLCLFLTVLLAMQLCRVLLVGLFVYLFCWVLGVFFGLCFFWGGGGIETYTLFAVVELSQSVQYIS